MLRLGWDDIDRVRAGEVLCLTRWRGAGIDQIYKKSRGRKVECEICSGFGLGIRKKAVVSVERQKVPMANTFDYMYKVHIYEVSDT